jgi:hypothetical protein
VLLGFFFAPAGLIMCFNLLISLYLAWMILGVRAKTRGLTRHTVREVLGLFFTVNSGSIACGMLALLFFAYSDNPLSYLSLVTGILFLLQAVSLWIVFFARRENLALWGLLITGSGAIDSDCCLRSPRTPIGRRAASRRARGNLRSPPTIPSRCK